METKLAEKDAEVERQSVLCEQAREDLRAKREEIDHAEVALSDILNIGSNTHLVDIVRPAPRRAAPR